MEEVEDEVKELIYEKGLKDFGHFGWVESTQLEKLLSNSDIVLPSWAEGFPNAVIEAMAQALL